VKEGIGQFPKCCRLKDCHFFDTKKVEDENHFFLKCLVYTHIKSQFQNICYNTDLPNLLTHQKFGGLGILLLMLFEHKYNSKTN
jgi:hypothetical protein